MHTPSFLLLLVAASVIGRPFSKRAPVPPSQDSFYTPPKNFGSSKPGTVLRSRQVTLAFDGAQPLQGYTAYQLLYRTTSANSTTPIATVTTVIKPNNANPNELLSFAFAEDSTNQTCAPSYELQPGAPQNNDIVAYEENLLVAFLDKGYTVSVPDYEGPDSAFSAGRLEGHAVLDGLRASINFPTLGFNNKTTRVGGYGYSGGSIANTWAAALHRTYASDLNVVGWASGGTPANLTGTLVYIDGTLFAGFVVEGIAGLVNAYQEAESLVNRVATPAGRAALVEVRQGCAGQALQEFAFKKFQGYEYQTEGPRIVYDPMFTQVGAQNILGTNSMEVPIAPIFLYHAMYDEVIPIANVTTLVKSWCSQGIKSLVYTINEGPAEHISEEFIGFPDAFNFLNDRFAGVPAVKGCVTNTTVFSAIDPGAAPAGFEVIFSDLETIVTGQIGPDDGIYKSRLAAAAALLGNTPTATVGATSTVSKVVTSVIGKATSTLLGKISTLAAKPTLSLR